MDRSGDDNSVVSDAMWRTWAQKDRKRKEATTRRRRRVWTGIALGIMALCAILYRVVVR